MQKNLGGKIAFVIEDQLIVDNPSIMKALPVGTFAGALLKQIGDASGGTARSLRLRSLEGRVERSGSCARS
eukprot:7957915-Prorocentrum_lima.AAC.1